MLKRLDCKEVQEKYIKITCHGPNRRHIFFLCVPDPTQIFKLKAALSELNSEDVSFGMRHIYIYRMNIPNRNKSFLICASSKPSFTNLTSLACKHIFHPFILLRTKVVSILYHLSVQLARQDRDSLLKSSETFVCAPQNTVWVELPLHLRFKSNHH